MSPDRRPGDWNDGPDRQWALTDSADGLFPDFLFSLLIPLSLFSCIDFDQLWIDSLEFPISTGTVVIRGGRPGSITSISLAPSRCLVEPDPPVVHLGRNRVEMHELIDQVYSLG